LRYTELGDRRVGGAGLQGGIDFQSVGRVPLRGALIIR
jgi:hypothetical protein